MIKTVETQNEGLKHAFMLTIPAADIEARVDEEVKRLAPQVRMPGFRPGKVPTNLVRKMHGESLRGDALNGAVREGVQQLLSEKNIRPAVQPEVHLDEEYAPGKDAEVRVTVEALPVVPPANTANLKLERVTVDPDDSAIDEQLRQLASQSKRWDDAPKGHAAANGDTVVIDFEGKVGGKPFDGGKGEDMAVELGAGRLIPGFEDQLIGAKVGDERDLKVTFPADYPAKNLAGKAAVFSTKVKAVKIGGENVIDDDFAKTLGLESLDKLRTILRDQAQQELNGLTRTHMKRQLLDELASRHSFEVPQSMVDAEYENILNQLRHEASHEADPAAAMSEIERDADEYRRIAERRVRLGLLLSEIGAANGVEVTENEMRGLIGQAAQQYQGEDQKRFLQLVQQEPMFAAQLRAPLFEDKVVDYLFSTAEISERKATRAELEADLEAEEGHIHGPGCGHDHGGAAAKPKGKKASAKASEDKPAKASKPAAKKVDVVEKPNEAPKPAKPLKSEPANKAAASAAKPAKAQKAAEKPVKAKTPAKAEKPAAKKAPKKA